MKDIHNYAPDESALTGRVILVTGATRGIGRAVAQDLVQHGATVILHGRSADKLQALYEELKELGPEPVVAQLDQSLTDEIDFRFGRLDGLLHNASILGDLTPIEHYNIALWQRVIHTNLNAPFILTRCLIPLLRRSEDASILFTTSGVGNAGRAYWGAYSASKFATEGLAQILADEFENTAVRVNYINPGSTRTTMRRAAFPAEDPDTLPTPESITGTYLYLLGQDSRGVSGERFECRPGSPPASEPKKET